MLTAFQVTIPALAVVVYRYVPWQLTVRTSLSYLESLRRHFTAPPYTSARYKQDANASFSPCILVIRGLRLSVRGMLINSYTLIQCPYDASPLHRNVLPPDLNDRPAARAPPRAAFISGVSPFTGS